MICTTFCSIHTHIHTYQNNRTIVTSIHSIEPSEILFAFNLQTKLILQSPLTVTMHITYTKLYTAWANLFVYTLISALVTTGRTPPVQVIRSV